VIDFKHVSTWKRVEKAIAPPKVIRQDFLPIESVRREPSAFDLLFASIDASKFGAFDFALDGGDEGWRFVGANDSTNQATIQRAAILLYISRPATTGVSLPSLRNPMVQ